ncbi:hypothetical protein HPB48_025539 [Haemaphysalis longicornis]|uniref:Ankyrin repeat domain-containing protein n=1 Tax=Haemaphysalis longicornis TaxID=44386 RepID=A0A9J6H9R6_HAELO|nr:hypothetical protein HPB48_025539 [Haemaphysalis longicornis]
MCPSDTYKVYKSGPNVRIDTTLLGFDQSNWQRGSRSYIFKGQEDLALMMEVDHEGRQTHVEQMQVLPPEYVDLTGSLRPSQEALSARLTSPVVATYVDTDKISFERNKSGILGWKSDKSENHQWPQLQGPPCGSPPPVCTQVFSASNVELVTKTRVEHLSEADKARHKAARSPLQSFLGTVEVEEGAAVGATNGDVTEWRGNPCHIRPEEYFNAKVDLGGRDIGRPREATIRTQKFRANLWLCEEYPLSLPQQILPIVDLMSINSTHFARLRDFITLQLPAGFPVKIEIPLFHVLNARITFGNINAVDESVPGVHTSRDQGVVTCSIDNGCFEAPSGYARLDGLPCSRARRRAPRLSPESRSKHRDVRRHEIYAKYGQKLPQPGPAMPKGPQPVNNSTMTAITLLNQAYTGGMGSPQGLHSHPTIVLLPLSPPSTPTPVNSVETHLRCPTDKVGELQAAYSCAGANKLRPFSVNDEDDELLQYAIEQSFVDAGGEEDQVTVWEALTANQAAVGPELEEDHALQRAIQESLASYQMSAAGGLDGGAAVVPASTGEVPQPEQQPQPDGREWTLGAGADLAMALRLSQQAKEEEDRRQREEDEMLERILQLSMTEK